MGIDPRLKPLREEAAKKTQKAKDGLGLRIVNRPNANTNSQINTCPLGQKACCYDPSVDHSSFGRSCIAPGASASQFESVRYGCNERVVNSGKQWQQVQLEPERDLCRRPGGEGRLYRRRRQSPRLPGTVWQVDCRWACHLGRWMRQRCSRSLR